MPLKVLIVPDKFKGTLGAEAAAQAIARGWGKVRPQDTLEVLPMSDGGDGFGEVMRGLLEARPQSVKTVDAAHRPCRACWWWVPKRKLAIIESARVVGLAMQAPGEFHPFELDTFGLGRVVRAAAAKGAQRCLVGIGGSATNDGGFGLARALGWEFRDRTGQLLERWTDLGALAEIRPPRRRRWFRELRVAVDVQNPLLGAHGATRVYGPQKGLRAVDFQRAEQCLRRLAEVAEKGVGRDIARAPGAGAAGGLGFGLQAFLSAELVPGFELFARLAGLERRLRGADLVLTGEGAIDRQTLMGKGVGRVAERCDRLGIPCIGLAGCVEADMEGRHRFAALHALTELTPLAAAKARPAHWLERLAARVARGQTRVFSRE